MKKFLILSVLVLFSGCFQVDSPNELNTTPVTNNPHIVPNGGCPFPKQP